jgi:hypothetical protein
VLPEHLTQFVLGCRERQISNVQFGAQVDSLAAAGTPRTAATLGGIRAGPSDSEVPSKEPSPDETRCRANAKGRNDEEHEIGRIDEAVNRPETPFCNRISHGRWPTASKKWRGEVQNHRQNDAGDAPLFGPAGRIGGCAMLDSASDLGPLDPSNAFHSAESLQQSGGL